MKTQIRILTFIGIFAMISCEDILEVDISNDTVQIISPQNNQEITSNVVNFQWNELDGANKYRVQVYSASSSLIIDSLVTQKNLSYPMNQGTYQWRVRAENAAYQSNYTFNNTFSVIETDDLTNQQVILLNPSDNLYTNNTSVILNWQSLNAADTYSFELINVTNGETIVNQQPNITTTSITLSNAILNIDAEYRWKIKAINTSSETAFSSRKIYLDRTSPNIPLNQTPVNNSIQLANQQLTFNWTIPADIGNIQSTVSYIIEYSNDINFGTIIQTSNTSTTSFQQTFTTAGDYYWRIKAKDAAGNIGSTSAAFKFTIN